MIALAQGAKGMEVEDLLEQLTKALKSMDGSV
jgi:hypothetical protein